MAVVHLHEKYNKSLIQAFDFSTNLTGKTSNQFEWAGVDTIILTDINSIPLNDYDRTAPGNRYGTPTEITDNQQAMKLQWDRSYPAVVDKGNYKEGNELKTGAAIVKAQMNEQVGPEMEKNAYNEWAKFAGTVVGASAPTKSTILDQLLSIETKMDDERVPKPNRFVAVKNEYVGMIRSSLLSLDNVTDRMLIRGIVGKIGSLHIIGASAHDVPANVHMLAWQKNSVVLPKTIMDSKVSYDIPGISGMIVEGRYRYGAFVVGKRASGVYTLCASSAKTANPKISGNTISCDTAGAVIYYTTDGSDPRYSRSAKIGTTVVGKGEGDKVKAFAIGQNMYGSDVVTEA